MQIAEHLERPSSSNSKCRQACQKTLIGRSNVRKSLAAIYLSDRVGGFGTVCGATISWGNTMQVHGYAAMQTMLAILFQDVSGYSKQVLRGLRRLFDVVRNAMGSGRGI